MIVLIPTRALVYRMNTNSSTFTQRFYLSRNRSSKVQLSAKVYDHCTHTFLKGFTYLSIAWSDGNSTYPVDFAMVSSAKDKNCLNPVDSMDIDARRSIDKRMIESR